MDRSEYKSVLSGVSMPLTVGTLRNKKNLLDDEYVSWTISQLEDEGWKVVTVNIMDSRTVLINLERSLALQPAF
jgi:hypothetical protein